MPGTFHHELQTLTSTLEHVSPQLLAHSLDDLRLIRVAGADRVSFLQGQLTQDVRTVNPSRSALFGWATAQGRLLCFGQMLEWRDALWLTAPAAAADALLPRLRKFVLRAKVSVEVGNATVMGLSGPGAATSISIGGVRLPFEPLAADTAGDCLVARVGGDPHRVLVLGDRAATTGLLSGLAVKEAAESEWRLADIRAGLPWIGPETLETFTPQMVNLDLIDAVSFDKGCYTGQEIVIRTHHLGRVKRRMVRFGCDAPVTPAPGAAIFGPEREAGRVVTAATTPHGIELLAVTQLDELAGPLFLDAGRRSALRRLDLPYRIPD